MPPPLTIHRWSAPAKVNLHLEVLGRRPDGFHELETVFQTLELADVLTVAPGGTGIELACDDPGIPPGPGNLVHRAAAAVLARRPVLGGVRLTLGKRLPHGAGLGGGSSDAATTLLALNQVLADPPFADPLPAAELAGMALELGSDVPFFLIGGTAHAVGRGEVLTPLPPLPRLPVTVLMPEGAHCATPAVFKALDGAERGPRPARGPAWFAAGLAALGIDDRPGPAAGEGLLANRLTGPAQRICPPVARLLGWLAACGAPHLMTGSGAACIALAHLDPPAGIRSWRTWTGPRAQVLAPGN